MGGGSWINAYFGDDAFVTGIEGEIIPPLSMAE